jgi:hypothetical protein
LAKSIEHREQSGCDFKRPSSCGRAGG